MCAVLLNHRRHTMDSYRMTKVTGSIKHENNTRKHLFAEQIKMSKKHFI